MAQRRFQDAFIWADPQLGLAAEPAPAPAGTPADATDAAVVRRWSIITQASRSTIKGPTSFAGGRTDRQWASLLVDFNGSVPVNAPAGNATLDRDFVLATLKVSSAGMAEIAAGEGEAEA